MLKTVKTKYGTFIADKDKDVPKTYYSRTHADLESKWHKGTVMKHPTKDVYHVMLKEDIMTDAAILPHAMFKVKYGISKVEAEKRNMLKKERIIGWQ